MRRIRSMSLLLFCLALIVPVSTPAPSVAQDASNVSDSTSDSVVRGAHLRIARPTDDLDAVVAFYRDGLGFDVLGSFEDHAGFDGVMLGHAGHGYHLELTHQRGHTAGKAPNAEHLLVFYLPDEDAWKAAVEQLESQGYPSVRSNNPYWERRGKTFEDPDGYRVVLQNARWG